MLPRAKLPVTGGMLGQQDLSPPMQHTKAYKDG